MNILKKVKKIKSMDIIKFSADILLIFCNLAQF